MSDLDTLRESAFINTGDDEQDINMVVFEEVEREKQRAQAQRFLGMTPAERMMLSIFLFMNVTVMMLAFLLATGRIQF